jgi:Enoyl-(Acyl carrier protein) reductase
VADADDVLFRQHLARDPLAVDVGPAAAAQVDDLEAAFRVAAELRVIPGDLEVAGQHDVVGRLPPDPDRLGRQGMGVRHGAILSGPHRTSSGLHALTRNLALELAPHQIPVNTVAPAVVASPVYEKFVPRDKLEETLRSFDAFHPLGRTGTGPAERGHGAAPVRNDHGGHDGSDVGWRDPRRGAARG